jgi:glycosyltransferase involved in cell wall biosynthesis
MSVYAGDRADWLAAALASIAVQSAPAAEVVVVEDGPLPPALRSVLDADPALRRLPLARNVGLAGALQHGVPHCTHELVARMDADDIAEPDRFATQAAELMRRPRLAVVGGYVAEFEDDPELTYAVRRVPTGAAEVARFARRRSPVNHPTVMFRRSAVLAVGGYEGFRGIEDYFLWAKLIAAGREVDNLPTVAVRQRAGAALGRRRGGLRYARTEVDLFRAFVRIGFLTHRQAAAGLAVRLPVRLVPGWLRAVIYRRLLRRGD